MRWRLCVYEAVSDARFARVRRHEGYKLHSEPPDAVYLLSLKAMADIPPINPGAAPLKKSTGRVQPKKETVRINLPPKPTAAPTIKLPTLPPGGPTGAASGSPLVPTPPSATTLRSSATPAAAAPRAAAAAPSAAPSAQQRSAPRPAAAAAAVNPLDKMLAIAAGVVGLAAIGTTLWMLLMLNAAVNS